MYRPPEKWAARRMALIVIVCRKRFLTSSAVGTVASLALQDRRRKTKQLGQPSITLLDSALKMGSFVGTALLAPWLVGTRMKVAGKRDRNHDCRSLDAVENILRKSK